MTDFKFFLAKNTTLQSREGSFYLFSCIPIRALKISQPLYVILQQIQSGKPLPEILALSSTFDSGQVLRNLLTLTSRGYLQLEKIGRLQAYPFVSIIIPVKNSLPDLLECLNSLKSLAYPRDRHEIIVVDDGSDRELTSDQVGSDIQLIRLPVSEGQAQARNIGVDHARGELLAFLDADCIVEPAWLAELVPFFEIEKIGAVGGFVGGYYRKGLLDRYEEVSSSLNMGKRVIFQNERESNFYLPTCNLLVSREIFFKTRGFQKGMSLGEDVDFCWRMRDKGEDLLYVPFGKVNHKHRSRLSRMLVRRFDYGTSEAVLYDLHRNKRKRFPLPVLAGLDLVALIIAIFLLNPLPLIAIPVIVFLDMVWKSFTLRKSKIRVTSGSLLNSVMRNHFSFNYFALFHITRYYLILLVLLGIFLYPFDILTGVAILLTSVTDYLVKKPRLIYPVYLFYYVLEHLFYQAGVFWGCLKRKRFWSYLPVFTRA